MYYSIKRITWFNWVESSCSYRVIKYKVGNEEKKENG